MLADLETQANSASSGNEFQEDSDSEEEQMEEQDFDSIFGQEQPKSEEKQRGEDTQKHADKGWTCSWGKTKEAGRG